MVEYNIKRYILATILVFIAVFLIIFFGANLIFNAPKEIWGIVTTSISVTAFIAILFVAWAWKWKVFRGWLVPFPNLNGTWTGRIKYLEEGNERTKSVSVDIKQTFLSIVVSFRTKESTSLSFCGSFNIDEKRRVKQLIYSYQNNPNTNVREKSPLHFGTTKLDISDDNSLLTGEYWTSRKTNGSIILKKKKPSQS